MNPCKYLVPAVLACAMVFPAAARASEDASRFQLNPAIMEKLKAAEADMKLLPKSDAAAPEVDPDQSIDAAIRKIEQDKQTVAVLARHGLSGRELVLSAHALLHAGSFVSAANTIDQKKSSELYKSYARQQQANIDLVRSMMRAK